MSAHPPKLTDTTIERLRTVAIALKSMDHPDDQFVRGVKSAAYSALREGGWDTERANHLIAALGVYTPTLEEKP